MTLLTEQVKNLLMEEANVQPVRSPVTVSKTFFVCANPEDDRVDWDSSYERCTFLMIYSERVLSSLFTAILSITDLR